MAADDLTCPVCGQAIEPTHNVRIEEGDTFHLRCRLARIDRDDPDEPSGEASRSTSD